MAPLLAKQSWTKEEFTTLIMVIEGLLNTRPPGYAPMGEIEKLITPADFLNGANGVSRVTNIDLTVPSLAAKYKRLHQSLDQWWKSFLKAFLPTLHARPKWSKETEELKEEDIVLIRDAPKLRGKWPLGLVLQIEPSHDGRARRILIKSGGKGTWKAAHNLCKTNLNSSAGTGHS